MSLMRAFLHWLMAPRCERCDRLVSECDDTVNGCHEWRGRTDAAVQA